jgi:fucose permease
MGISEIIGGVFAPSGAGWIADRHGLAVPLWILAGLCVAIALLSLALEKRRWSRTARRSSSGGES